MDRIWQWAWDRYGATYSWAFYAITFPFLLPIYLLNSSLIVAFEESDHYVEAAAVTVVAALVLVYVMVFPGLGQSRLVEQWAAGHDVDRTVALDATYRLGGRLPERSGATSFGPPRSSSSSARSPGRMRRGWSSSGLWAPSWDLPSN